MSKKDFRKRILEILQNMQEIYVPIDLLEDTTDEIMEQYYGKCINENSTDDQIIKFIEKYLG